MSRSFLPLLSCLVLLSGCATLTEPEGIAVPEIPVVIETAPETTWPDVRAAITASLRDTNDLEVRTLEDGALLVRLPAAEGFARNSTEPTAALQTMLGRVADALIDADDTELFVLGHTDSIGSELYNLQLSIHRAEAVMEVLRARGIALARLHADGRGEAEPIADNATEAGRAINRRVEIIVRPFD